MTQTTFLTTGDHTMISWHKVGQKVATVRAKGCSWRSASTDATDGPGPGEVCTIAEVKLSTEVRSGIVFILAEYPPDSGYSSVNFRPVYPTAIEELRKLGVPAERVRETALAPFG